MQQSSAKPWATAGFLLSVGALAAALFFQISKEWFPCPLCILQRYAYLATALGFLGIGLSSRQGVLGSAFALLALAGFVSGAGVAFYHVWVLANPLETCGVDPLQNTLNALPWVQYWPDMFMADGLCTEEYPPLYGLSLPMWSGIGFLAQGFVLLLALRAKKQFRRSW
ncbi:disulfide bond formation protein B [Limnobacter parvus]|uniref:Disulfide bond formation protein B n=1 Tax=Limnobacter parvus TaxID=2939690 RepID=A0ABT1XET2_9BURK|nr:disulfide bond formation protein B [Limnobacter parvus]MCR2745649.1 disulfide bond formation protein B [Limnobacter parvus]